MTTATIRSTVDGSIEPSTQPNLDYLHGTQDALGLDRDQSTAMLNYLIGALSAVMPAGMWTKAVDSVAAPFEAADRAEARQ